MLLKRQPKFLPEVRGCESLTRIGSAFRRLPGWLVCPARSRFVQDNRRPMPAVILKAQSDGSLD